jgi:predicted DNA-binding transcriptional regulator AlpA
MRARDVANALGVDVKCIYNAVHRREIPGAFWVGRLLFFRRPVVLAWLRQGAPSEE